MYSKITVLVFVYTVTLLAQVDSNLISATLASKRLESFRQKLELMDQSLFKNLKASSIGPTVMSGRIVDVDVNPLNSNEFYAAYASGGVWRTSNNGTSFTPVFENQPAMTIGDIAVNWGTHSIYVGTGEKNSSRSSYSGQGVFRSDDTGKTWVHLGLEEIHHTGRIIIDNQNPDILFVAALGHLYSANPERGVYKSTDNGKSWKHTLKTDDNTGAVDILQDPVNPNILYSAMWFRTRRAWNFEESGNTSGIYKSIDRGDTWVKMNTGKNGFPDNNGVGRIGLSMLAGKSDILFAVVDNQNRRTEVKPIPLNLTKEKLRTLSAESFMKITDQDINAYLDYYGFPDEYNAKNVKEKIQNGIYKPVNLVEYLEDGNAMLFDTPVFGAEVYKTTDGAQTWQKTHEKPLDDFVYSYGYYFGEVNAAPSDENILYVLGVPLLKSVDGGKTFFSVQKENAHVDHHILWINPADPNHLINGNDGGLNISYDGGENWIKCNTPAVGQFYTVAVDNAEPYNVYGGLQDNGVWYGPNTYRQGVSWHQYGHYLYTEILGGDGMEIQVDLRDDNTIYTGYQFGNYYRFNKTTKEETYISPVHKLGERPYRFNWKTPIRLSKHNQDILYIGGEKLFRSMDKGATWKIISGDLTTGGKTGDVPYSTITTISESPLTFGTLYIGTDDGLIHLSLDGGFTWNCISVPLPEHYWISSLQASVHNEKRIYAALNGYRWDNFEANVFVSEDYGKTWERLGNDLPAEAVNAILEDPVNENILYLGTDHSLYISLNRGKNFFPFNAGLPSAPVHALVIQVREKDLIVATHGRSLYKIELEELEQLNDTLIKKPLHVFTNALSFQFDKNWGDKTYTWGETRTRKANISFYLKEAGDVKLSILSKEKSVLFDSTIAGDRGLNFMDYTFEVNESGSDVLKKDATTAQQEFCKQKENGKYYLIPGSYSIIIESGGERAEVALTVKEKQSKRE